MSRSGKPSRFASPSLMERGIGGVKEVSRTRREGGSPPEKSVDMGKRTKACETTGFERQHIRTELQSRSTYVIRYLIGKVELEIWVWCTEIIGWSAYTNTLFYSRVCR